MRKNYTTENEMPPSEKVKCKLHIQGYKLNKLGCRLTWVMMIKQLYKWLPL